MNKIKTITFSAMLAAAPLAVAQVSVNLPSGSDLGTLVIEHCLVTDIANPPGGNVKITSDSVAVVDGKASFNLDPEGPARYIIPVGEREAIDFYALPNEKLEVNVTSVDPLSFKVTGSEFVEDILAMDDLASPIALKYRETVTGPNPTEDELKKILADYEKVFTDFLAAKPTSPAAAYALMQLDGEDFLNQYDILSTTIETSPLYPLVAVKYAKEKKKHDLMSGKFPAPEFTLKNLEGKDVSLSDFRGKWVVLDFWGSWCIWCIKGFPALKEAYNQYAGKFEVIGIDCNELEENWRAGVKKYQLPWVNVYNPTSDSSLLEKYSVQGFPTKIIVNPEGNIVDITTGEDPEFFTKLKGFLGV